MAFRTGYFIWNYNNCCEFEHELSEELDLVNFVLLVFLLFSCDCDYHDRQGVIYFFCRVRYRRKTYYLGQIAIMASFRTMML